ncbi:hypothetical protein DMENIID0001_119190 [Sergentomyia squamirostris]
MKTFLISLALIAVTSAGVLPTPTGLEFKHFQDVNVDGSYKYSYETPEGIVAHESGVGGELAEGSVRWIAPDGTPVEFNYRADASGYVASGSHVPETPEYVYRALEWIRSHPSVEHDKYTYPGAYKSVEDKYTYPTYKYSEVSPVVPVVTQKPYVVPTYSTVSPVLPVTKYVKPTEFKYKSSVFPTVKPAVTVFKPVSYTTPTFPSKFASVVV